MNVRLIVPNCNRNTSPLVAYGKAIAEIAGGFTATQGTGGWIDGQGALIVEPVVVFDCSFRGWDETLMDDGERQGSIDLNNGTRQEFRDLAKRIARDLRQDSVYLLVDGVVELV